MSAHSSSSSGRLVAGAPAVPPAVELALLGYLNFSSGEPNAAFQRALNELWPVWNNRPTPAQIRDCLLQAIENVRGQAAGFDDPTQAVAVVKLTFDHVWPAYRQHHRDLLFHLNEADFLNPFFVARMMEAVLAQGGIWKATYEDAERTRICEEVVDRLNDFLGYRLVAVLENGQQMEPYPHERFRPVPLYLADAGVAHGPYHDLITRTIEFFDDTPLDIQHASHFDVGRMREFAVDVRAYDHLHPVNKRTNYMFGEWDPHQISTKGYFERFVVRKVILDALLNWMHDARERNPDVPATEVLYDAAAVLCGTMLMASSVSGSGPGMHDSATTLTSLLPMVARQRDLFYDRLVKRSRGKRGERLRHEAELTQQPFGHVRQRLNIELARYGARQMQTRHLSRLYAEMGYFTAARAQAAVIPTPSARFDTEIQCSLTETHLLCEHGDVSAANAKLEHIESLLLRAIDCGAMIDPWNILGFQGQFPLFHTREDALHDLRAEALIDMMERIFRANAHALREAAARGETALESQIRERFTKLADWWDAFATTTVNDLPKLNGAESVESAQHVARTLSEWQRSGAEAGDISFWRQHSDDFRSPKAYAVVVDALLEKRDLLASMGLLMQWLSEADDIGLNDTSDSFPQRLLRWMQAAVGLVQQQSRADRFNALPREESLQLVCRMFDYLEANAEDYWQAPGLGPEHAANTTSEEEVLSPEEIERMLQNALDKVTDEDDEDDDELSDYDDDEGNLEDLLESGLDGDDFDEAGALDGDEPDDDDESNIFSAAYEGVTFRDSADDGVFGDTADEGGVPGDSAIEALTTQLEPRLRFLEVLAELWQMAAPLFVAEPAATHGMSAGRKKPPAEAALPEALQDRLLGWADHAARLQRELKRLLVSLSNYELSEPQGDHDSNVEYDEQLQTKFYLLQTTIATCVNVQAAERSLRSMLPLDPRAGRQRRRTPEETILRLLSELARGRTPEVKRSLPGVLRYLSGQPLLYVPLNNDGDPEKIRAAQSLHGLLRQLVTQLPRLGLLHETWQVVNLAYRMERTSRPGGQAVTEFDQLFRLALRNSVDCVIAAASRPSISRMARGFSIRAQRDGRAPSRKERRAVSMKLGGSLRPGRVPRLVGSRPLTTRGPRRIPAKARQNYRDHRLLRMVSQIVIRYSSLWLKHSSTTRLSTVESLADESLWTQVRNFISRYGSELFHARMLTLGHVRTILHRGVEDYLEHLEVYEDPLHPLKLVEDMQQGRVQHDEVVESMELIYGSLVDRIDRFIEYNTTTTQSDYGEMFYSLLDFLRLEAAYERDAWQLTPFVVAHEQLAAHARSALALQWERAFAEQNRETAEEHLSRMQQLEQSYGMHLPALTDRIQERFVKPLIVNRMQALIKPAIRDARRGRQHSPAFESLRKEVQAYLDSTSGSVFDVPPWLRHLEKQVQIDDPYSLYENDPRQTAFPTLAETPDLRSIEQQLKRWDPAPRRKKRR